MKKSLYFWIKSALACFLLIMNVSCSTDPVNAGVSEEEINAEAAKAYLEVKSKSKISQNQKWNQMVQRVAQRIARASGENFQWEAVLIESPELNAWCMPGGKIAVYTGIMPVLKTEAALAAVMGHEVAHATLRHGMKGYARAKQESYAGLILAGATIIGGELLCKTQECKQWTQIGGMAAGFGLTFLSRKFSREDESAADQSGQLLMARAGYDPAESVQLWQRMNAAKQGQAPPEFMSTHPSDQTRQQTLNTWLITAKDEYAKAPAKYGLGEVIR
jgi:predicted Zn-dependent protease